MTTEEIIQEFDRIKKEDPEYFYHALGCGHYVMSDFVSGSYELGLVAGARYALDHFLNRKED